MSVSLLYLLKPQLCTDSNDPSCDDPASNLHKPATTKTTARKMLSSGDEVNEKVTTKKTTARVQPSRKNQKPSSDEEVRKTANKKRLYLVMTLTPECAGAFAKIIATSQKKGQTKCRPTRNA